MARRVAVSWSGGKDSNLALHRVASDAGVAVVCLVVFHPPKPAFRAHPVAMMELQAAALGLPLVMLEVDAALHGGDHRAAYAGCIRRLRAEHGVYAIVTGDMDLVGTMPRNFITEVCEMAALTPPMECLLPLWGADRRGVLDELLALGLRARFSCVKSPHFDASWIGRALDDAAVKEMEGIRERTGLDLCGENGEYHSCVVDGPLYRSAIAWDAVGAAAAEELEGAKGQAEDVRWWVLRDLAELGARLEEKAPL
uniref:Diphthine--ammonia ligase n=1 Tax=Phaeomonas parva TaxID=124430 RepID=A0A7S1U715_9STRA|mmetsp:Transcript_34395/g.108344  ORF Transcript_34395/g.108344 Transcript_34395/m.108344 type:complete len:254 (+) Transcript_34395:146-907(+)